MALSIMGRAAEEDGDALVVGGVHAVHLLLQREMYNMYMYVAQCGIHKRSCTCTVHVNVNV